MLIDYHAHVNFNAYKNDADEVIKRSHEGGVFMVLVGSQIDTSRRAVEMAAKYDRGVWAAVGLHPIHLEDMEVDEEEDHFATRKEVFDPAAYRALARHPKVVAIGECGLDYWHIAPTTPNPSSGRRGNENNFLPSWRGGEEGCNHHYLRLRPPPYCYSRHHASRTRSVSGPAAGAGISAAPTQSNQTPV